MCSERRPSTSTSTSTSTFHLRSINQWQESATPTSTDPGTYLAELASDTSAKMSDSSPRRIAQIIHIKRDSLQAYKDSHAAAWPAVLKQIKDCNISDYSIYLDEQSMTLFASMKYTGTDFEADMQKMKANPEVQRWWRMTDGMQESLVEGSKGSMDEKGWWKDLEEVFRCE